MGGDETHAQATVRMPQVGGETHADAQHTQVGDDETHEHADADAEQSPGVGFGERGGGHGAG